MENTSFRFANIFRIFTTLLFVAVVVFVAYQWKDSSNVYDSLVGESCNVAKVNLHGSLYTYKLRDPYASEATSTSNESTTDEASSEEIVNLIEKAKSDQSIKALVLDVDSPGGSPVAGEEIANALKRLGKPSAALIRDSGNSAAYWASTGADHIVASANSSVGSIGVTASYLDVSKQNESEGVSFEQISIGKFKDAGNPNLPLSKEAKDLFLKHAEEIYNNFVTTVATNRSLPIETVKAVADGSDMTGSRAKDVGLIDEIGDRATVLKYLTTKVGDNITVCW